MNMFEQCTSTTTITLAPRSAGASPERRTLRCDLKAGHSGPHQTGGSQVWIEWEDEDG